MILYIQMVEHGILKPLGPEDFQTQKLNMIRHMQIIGLVFMRNADTLDIKFVNLIQMTLRA